MKVRTDQPPMNPYSHHGPANGILHCLSRGGPINHITELRDMLAHDPSGLLAYVEAWIAEPVSEREARRVAAAEKRERFLPPRKSGARLVRAKFGGRKQF